MPFDVETVQKFGHGCYFVGFFLNKLLAKAKSIFIYCADNMVRFLTALSVSALGFAI
jgi:hypothetical protein